MTFLYYNGEDLPYMSDDSGLATSTVKGTQPIPPTWRHLGMDLICDLPESEDGYKHSLVTVIYLSKYVAVRPLKTKTSQEVIQNLRIFTSISDYLILSSTTR